jgi:uncharacterized phage protein gp47/JayE
MDLTRWNRAGLRRFRYVDGNAATFLEELRVRLSQAFEAESGWKRVHSAPTSVDGGAGSPAEVGSAQLTPEQARLRNALLERQYVAPTGDMGWEIARAFARACHILTEHIDAYANEGFLGTATQWEYLRRLLDALDHHPAPPASASTSLVLLAKPGLRVTVEAGLPVRLSASRPGPPIVFETLEDLKVDAALNELRPLHHDRSPELLFSSADEATVVVEGKLQGVTSGQPVVFEDEEQKLVFTSLISSVRAREETTEIAVARPFTVLHEGSLEASPARSRKGFVRIHVAPRDQLDLKGPLVETIPGGTELHLLDEPTSLRPGIMVCIDTGSALYFRQLTGLTGRTITLKEDVPGSLHRDRASVAPALPLAPSETVVFFSAREIRVAGDHSRLHPDDPAAGRKVLIRRATGDFKDVNIVRATYVAVNGSVSGGYTSLVTDDPSINDAQTIYVQPVAAGLRLDSHLAPGVIEVSTARSKAATPDGFLVLRSEQKVFAGRIDAVTHDDSSPPSSALTVASWSSSAEEPPPLWSRQTQAYTGFRVATRSVNWTRNQAPLPSDGIPLDIPNGQTPPESLQPGRRLIFERTDVDLAQVPGAAVETTVVSVGSGAILHVLPQLPATAGFSYGNAVIRGNVVTAGHGKSQPEAILGSGDATASNQVLILDQQDVSFVADPTQPTGVRADIAVSVEGQIWEQRGDLYGSGPGDPHYTVRVTEAGTLGIGFGDGEHGRRLPTGLNNVRVRSRMGAGPAGTLPARMLEKLGAPHQGLAGVRQPLPTAGGNDKESATSFRSNAAASALSSGRAVSLEDVAQVAAQHSSVVQARARLVGSLGSRQDDLEVIVVPAGDHLLDSLKSEIAQHVGAKTLPGVGIRVSSFTPVLFGLKISLNIVAGAFDPKDVEARVREALTQRFERSRRRLGQSLSLAEIFATIEAVRGVNSSQCAIVKPPDDPRAWEASGVIRSIRAAAHEVVSLSPDPAHVKIEPKGVRG